MDEEIDDERKARINQYGSADIYTLRRLKQELGVRPTAHVEAEAILGSRIDGLVRIRTEIQYSGNNFIKLSNINFVSYSHHSSEKNHKHYQLKSISQQN